MNCTTTIQTPSEIIYRISNAIDMAEIYHDPDYFVEARRLLNNDLRQAIETLSAQVIPTTTTVRTSWKVAP